MSYLSGGHSEIARYLKIPRGYFLFRIAFQLLNWKFDGGNLVAYSGKGDLASG